MDEHEEEECWMDPVRKALWNYHRKQLRSSKPKRRNQKPEKQVEKSCMQWMRESGWDMQVVEAKNAYNPKAGRWVSSSVSTGTADSLGTLPCGTFAAVEFKAPGRLTTFNRPKNHPQRQYIRTKINTFAFACVVDSVERLNEIHAAWEEARRVSKEAARDVLISFLP